MTNRTWMLGGMAALALVAASGGTTAAWATPGDGPRELRARVTEQQSALPGIVATTVTVPQAVSIAQSATRGVATAASFENRPDGQVVVVDVLKDGVRSEVVINRASSKVERVTRAGPDVTGETVD